MKLADNKGDWRNLAHALDIDPTVKKFSPTSVSIKEVLTRLGELVSTFSKEHLDFCIRHIERRNSEIHTGELIFASLARISHQLMR